MNTPQFDFQLAILSGQSRLEKGQMELLGHIQTCGTLTEAAKAQGISYKTACAWMDSMNKAADLPLVSATHGGKERGGTVITSMGIEYLRRYRRIHELHQKLQEEIMNAGDFTGFMQRLRMRSSARNHFAGIVERIHGGSVRNLVNLRIFPNISIQALVSASAVKEMKLTLGTTITAAFKASSVLLEKYDAFCRPLPTNCWNAKPVEVREDAEGVEVLFEIGNDLLLSGLFDIESWNASKPHEGGTCLVLIPPAHVTLVKGD